MIFTADDYYMNHVYLSEFWLWQYMEKHFINHPSYRWQKQRLDEKKHTAMTRGALFKTTNRDINAINHNLNYSIEKSIYENIGGIDVDNLPLEDFPAFVYVVERRATLMFKIYIKTGKNDYYKKVLKRIVHDEADHLDIHKDTAITTDAYLRYQEIDKKIWNDISNIYTNKNTAYFNNIQYWKDLFSDKLRKNIHGVS